MFIKSNKLLILVTTLCIMVTNNSNASNVIEKLDIDNIEHGSSVIVNNLETVVLENNNHESHSNNKVNQSNVENEIKS